MENSFASNEPSQDLLTDLTINIEHASVGKRFANYLVDLVVFLIIFGVLFGVLMGLGILSEDINPIVDRLVTLLLFALWMGLQETVFKGKSIGKMITRTRAVNEDGSKISAGTAFVRGFSRAVPFEAFSAFGGHPWHDKWTHTYVIDETKSILPK